MSPRLQALLAVLASVVIAAAGGAFPLLAVPSYEPGVLLGAFACLACAHLAFERARARPPTVGVKWGLLDVTPSESIWNETRSNARAAAALVLAPLLPMLARAVGTGCDVAGGVWTYLFVAAPAAFGGMALGTLAGSLTRRRGPALLMVLGFVAATFLAALAELLAGPRMIVHELLLGPLSASAYAGYDSGLAFPPSAYLHRAFAVVAFAAMLVLAALHRTRSDAPAVAPGAEPEPASDPWQASRADDAVRARFLLRHHRRAVLRALAVVALAALPFLGAPHACGLLSGRKPLERALSAVAVTEHFEIHAAPGTAAEAHLERLAVELEWDFEQVRGWLGTAPRGRIGAWIHPDDDSLHRLTGARGFLFAQPWNREFHAVLVSGRVRALRHELVHVMAADEGLWPFRASLSMALTEGLATALDEGFVRAPESHAQVAAAAADGKIPHARDLVSLTGFAAGEMDRSYRSSASLVGWLLREEGPGPLLRAYAWADLPRAYGRSLEELDAGWRAFLAEVPRTRRSDATGRERFDPAKRPAFHSRPCARLGASSGPTMAERAALLAREGFAEESAAAWCEAAVAGSDPAHLHGAAVQHVRSGHPSLALPLVDRALEVVPEATVRHEQLLRLRMRLLAHLGRPDDAAAAFEAWRGSGLAAFADDVALEGEALGAREELRADYFGAALARAPEDARLATALVAKAPGWAPAMSLLLSRGAADLPVPAARSELGLAFAAQRPGPLAARYLLDVAEEHARSSAWDSAARLSGAALEQPGLTADLRLEAEDLAGRAAWAPRVTVVR